MSPKASVPSSRPSSGAGKVRSAPRSLPKSINPSSPVVRSTAFSGRVTKAGSPIIIAKSGKTFSVPQRGVFSTKMSLMSGVSKTALTKSLDHKRVAVLQTRIIALSSSVGAARNPGSVTKASSPIWKGFKNHRGDIKTNGLKGNEKKYYQWDYTHGDIEVYNAKGKHLGSIDPNTGEMYKPAVAGRELRK
ncbi:MAG: hypothetical protein H6864_05700 [Micavibrio sp.]|nr:hypothetical protein [Micavibrio sp.]